MPEPIIVPVPEAEWRIAVDDLVKSSKAAGAIHRPLLLLYLFGRAQRGEPREVEFAELKKPIAEALENLGRAKKAEPMLPFWHLQSSPFWEVLGADALPRREGKDRPTHGALIKANAKGALRPAWWTTLVEQPGLADRLGEHLLLSDIWKNDATRTEAAQRTSFRRPSPPPPTGA
jgi:hypothetical protein